jgi:hypothetical protein
MPDINGNFEIRGLACGRSSSWSLVCRDARRLLNGGNDGAAIVLGEASRERDADAVTIAIEAGSSFRIIACIIALRAITETM